MSLPAALDLARSLACEPWIPVQPDGVPRTRRLVVGDPQAPLERFLGLFARRGLLGADGMLLPDLLLVSVGDHFDWGGVADRPRAEADALALLRWLAAHPPDQVVLIAGNHDLGRVGELVDLDAPTWERARDEATALYYRADRSPEAEAEFLTRYPMFPTVEVAARDMSGFTLPQRPLVEALLRAGRLRFGYALSAELIAVHAGVAAGDLEVAGLPPSERRHAPTVAEALHEALRRAVAGWRRGPLSIPGLHEPGSAATGEAGGCLFHRPADPRQGDEADFQGPRRRRYDPRQLPIGLTQVVGHVRDHKCRWLMPAWRDDAPAMDGVLRHLLTDGARVAYAHGLARPGADQAGLVFVDAGMNHASPDVFPLLDPDAFAAA